MVKVITKMIIKWTLRWSDYHQALRDAASTRSGGVNVSQGHSGLGSYPRWEVLQWRENYRTFLLSMDQTPVLTEELKRHLAESRAANEYRSQQVKTELTKRNKTMTTTKMNENDNEKADNRDDSGPGSPRLFPCRSWGRRRRRGTSTSSSNSRASRTRWDQSG